MKESKANGGAAAQSFVWRPFCVARKVCICHVAPYKMKIFAETDKIIGFP